MTVDLLDDDNETFARYMLVFGDDDPPGFTNIMGVVAHRDDEDLTRIVVITCDGQAETVSVDHSAHNDLWSIWSSSGEEVIEEIAFDPETSEIRFHWCFVRGFQSTDVPVFA